jgi:hypothetical protein
MTSGQKLVIYGNGTIAMMMKRYLSVSYEVDGFTVDNACITASELDGIPVVDFASVETCYPPSEFCMIIAVGFVRMNAIRRERAVMAREKGYRLVNYVHPSVDISLAEIKGDNNILLEHASLHPGTVVESDNFISSNTNIGHGCRVGNGCWFNAGVSIGGETTIRDGCVFSINSGANNNLIVEEETFVGPGCFLARSSQPGDVFLTEHPGKYRLASRSFLKLMNVG